MKICIYSSYAWIKKANNYGSILQYFALQTYLEKNGHKVFWLRYNPKRKNALITKIISFFLKRKNNSITYKHQNEIGFQLFEDKFLNESNIEYKKYSQLRNNTPIADAYITGSDQVWAGISPERYLEFAPKKARKISYAASFGSPKFGFLNNILYSWRLRNIDYISVRENVGINFCKKYHRNDAICTCDPTFLLEKKEYEEYLSKENKVSKPYIFVYLVNPIKSLNDIYWKEISDFAKKQNLNLLVCAIQGAEFSFDKNVLISPDPLEWLQIVHDAKYVITSSFHGIAFSIIMRKQFVVIPQTGKTSVENLRFYDLINNLGLSEKIINNTNPIDLQLFCLINWGKVERRLNRLRNISFSFLDKSLNNNTI